MRTASVGYSSVNLKPVVTKVKKKPMLKNPIPYENQIKASDVLPASALLGATLAAIYMVRGGNYNTLLHEVSLKNLAKKSDAIISNFRNSEFLVNKEIKPLKKGFSKVLFTGQKGNKTINHSLVFDLGGELSNQLRSTTKLETVEGIPIGYNKKTQYIKGLDKHVSFVETDFTLNMKPRKTKVIKNGNVKEIVYGYDFNGKNSGIAYTDGNKVTLKLKNSEPRKFNSFEDIFNSEIADNFRQI